MTGSTLRGAACLVLALAAPSCSSSGVEPRPATDRRLILIGLDAADERLIAQGIEAGRLPNFARIRREGTSGPLRTHKPILSPILWTTMATGMTPDRHGVLDFLEEDAQGRTIPITSRSLRAPPFWRILEERGISCATVGWLATYPASAQKGIVVSDRFTIHPYGSDTIDPSESSEGKTWPPELYGALRDTIVSPTSIDDGALSSVFGVPPEPADAASLERRSLRVIEATTRTYEEVALRIARDRSPNLLAVYFEGIDRLMHLVGDTMPPPLPGVDAAKARRYGGAVTRFYEAMDARLGRLMAAVGEMGTVIIVSDHGFRIGAERPRHPSVRGDPFAAEWHKDPGILMAWGRGVRAGARIEGADIYDVTPTVLAFFGAPAAETMRGRALAEIFEPSFLGPELPRVPSYALREPDESARIPIGGDAGTEEILENLQALGYVAPGQSAATRAEVNLATYYLEEKQYQRAIEIYKRALAADPANLIALFNLGYAHKAMGSPAEAIPWFERALAARPDDLEARCELAECYVTLGQAGRALGILRAAGRAAETDPDFVNHLGTALASAGRLDEAERALERAIALGPSGASPYLNLARVQAAKGDREGAMETLRSAARFAPEDPRVAARIAELTSERAPR